MIKEAVRKVLEQCSLPPHTLAHSDESYRVPYAAASSYCTMCSNPTGPYALGHYLVPVYSHPNQPLTLVWGYFGSQHEAASHVEYHHYYGLNPLYLSSPPWHYQQQQHMPPAVVSHVPAQPLPQAKASWPEGATLKVELHWGKLARVHGPQRDLPDFVREDLRRVYGTYPRTDVSVTYRDGEYVVQGDPHVGNQEYRVEKKVLRRLESPHEDHTSETAEGKKKKK